MNLVAVTRKLSLLQKRLEVHRDRPQLADFLEETYWGEVDRLRRAGAYERLPYYVGWLASYRGYRSEDRGSD